MCGMTPEEVGERMVALLTADAADAPAEGTIIAGVSGGGPAHERAVLDVPAAMWWAAIDAARDPGALGCDFFDWLSAVDELDEGFTVVAHLWSTRRKHGLLVRARLTRENPVVESVVDLFPGAAWHERETHEMFGIAFSRHPDLRPLLLPPGFEGNPLRKEFVLASRVAKAWPGAKEPGESEAGTAKRAPMRPPGVPDPNEWGPMKGKIPPPETPARRGPGDRPTRAGGAVPGGERPARPARPAPGDRPVRPAPGERPVRPAPGERPVRPASDERPARPAGERPARPVPGDGPAQTASETTPDAGPAPTASETTPDAGPAPTASETTPDAGPDPSAPDAAPGHAAPPAVDPATAGTAGTVAAGQAEAAEAGDRAGAEQTAADQAPPPATPAEPTTPPESGTPPETGTAKSNGEDV
jgi:NADH-quinone oxidoreductase subunit C